MKLGQNLSQFLVFASLLLPFVRGELLGGIDMNAMIISTFIFILMVGIWFEFLIIIFDGMIISKSLKISISSTPHSISDHSQWKNELKYKTKKINIKYKYKQIELK